MGAAAEELDFCLELAQRMQPARARVLAHHAIQPLDREGADAECGERVRLPGTSGTRGSWRIIEGIRSAGGVDMRGDGQTLNTVPKAPAPMRSSSSKSRVPALSSFLPEWRGVHRARVKRVVRGVQREERV